MAEVRQCLRSGASRFPLTVSRRSLPESRRPPGDAAAQAAVPPGGSGRVAVVNVGLSGAPGGGQDGHTRLPPPSLPCPGPRGDCPPSGTRVTAWRTICLRGGWRGSGSSPSAAQLSCVRRYSGSGAGSEPLHKTRTGYYDVLGVRPAATQAQIKTAYYRQSFVYHPDRNSGSDEATVRFSEVSEAYTVLGDKGLRKKYDRGLLTLSDLASSRRPSGKGASGSGGPQSLRAAVGPEQRDRVYDFDSFFKNHYSGQLQRQKDIRVRREDLQRKRDERLHEKSPGRMTEVGLALMLLLALGLVLSVKRT